MVGSEARSWAVFPLIGFSIVFGLTVGFLCSRPATRTVDPRRVEACLQAYIDHRRTGDAEELKRHLAEMSLTPGQFEKIIDRFLHYRQSKSAMEQASRLLEAFRGGSRIVPERVVSSGGEAQTGFELDAEVLTVFQDKPDFVKEAFGG